MGELTLRRRFESSVGLEIFEVKLADEFLMSSLFTVAEEQLAVLGLASVHGDQLEVLVGGLGLGYTAVAALDDARVNSVTVIDALGAVIEWHQQRLLPVSDRLVSDARTCLVLDDFFDLMRRPQDEGQELAQRYDAILLDVDHSPRHQLAPSHADLYTSAGLALLDRHLKPAGVFALWSDDPPDDNFMRVLATVFDSTNAHVVEFDNPITGGRSSNTVYVAHNAHRALP